MQDFEPDTQEESEVGDTPGTVLVRTADAASILKIADRTVRKRLNNGELQGTKINNTWLVELPRDRVEAAGIEIPEVEEGDEDLPVVAGLTRSGHAATGTGPMPSLEPMAELIADLTRQSVEAAAAAAMWQERAQRLEEQSRNATLALESGQQEADRKIEEMQKAIETARQEAAEEARAQVNAEWKSKSWWQRLKGE